MRDINLIHCEIEGCVDNVMLSQNQTLFYWYFVVRVVRH